MAPTDGHRPKRWDSIRETWTLPNGGEVECLTVGSLREFHWVRRFAILEGEAVAVRLADLGETELVDLLAWVESFQPQPTVTRVPGEAIVVRWLPGADGPSEVREPGSPETPSGRDAAAGRQPGR